MDAKRDIKVVITFTPWDVSGLISLLAIVGLSSIGPFHRRRDRDE